MSITKEQTETKLDEVLSYPYALIVHNDPINTFEHVISSLMKVCGCDEISASQIAHIVHFKGKCDAKRGDKETISDMYNKLMGYGLTVSMEEV
jgi:ATP-dependent Clp protease adaptor protein ClpS